MQGKKIIKMALLNTGIALTNIVLFSEGLMAIRLGQSPFETALAVSAFTMSIGIFAVGNYGLMQNKVESLKVLDLTTSVSCIEALERTRSVTFANDIEVILLQTDRFTKKKITIQDILLQKFSQTEMSYEKFRGAVEDVEQVFYLNIKSILNRLNAFDEEDYKLIQTSTAAKKFSQKFITSKLDIYQTYIDFVKDAIEDNEEILLKLDRLLLEISMFNSLEDGEVENMSAMIEIDELINKTKYYK